MTDQQTSIQTTVERRLNFAIVSHPDAGKTTLTEKLLLYGGALQEAGSVKSRRARRHAASDWMEVEQQRGISVTSTVLQFEYQGVHLNLLDTPGHRDFGEDTYRTLTAADNAVVLIDSANGIEEQTRKLFAVCRVRSLPTFAFINKLDRAGRPPLELLDQIEKEFGLPTYAVDYPIGVGNKFTGVFDCRTGEVHLFERRHHGQREAAETVFPLGDRRLRSVLPPEPLRKLQEDAELLDRLGVELDLDSVHRGRLIPVFFGSAVTNFGVKLFLDAFLRYASRPGPHRSSVGVVAPTYPEFSGFVFKIQANMDPRHRDCLAFVRICSGKFTKDMTVRVARTGRTLRLGQPRKVFAREREAIDEAYPGDVVGIVDRGLLSIGDTVHTGTKLVYPEIPAFPPEMFAYLVNPDTLLSKKFQKGITQLEEEGTVQILRSADGSRRDPILAAVGELQFEVVQFRLASEYGVESRLEPLPHKLARWVTGGRGGLRPENLPSQTLIVKDRRQRPVLLFKSAWHLQRVESEHPGLGLSPTAPTTDG